MGKRAIIGNSEALLLGCLLRLDNEAYGVPLRQTAEEVSGRPMSVGALYTTLDRMEEKGFISSRVGEATPERGGRAKKYFKIEGAGQVAYQEWQEAQRRIQESAGALRQPTLQPTGGMA